MDRIFNKYMFLLILVFCVGGYAGKAANIEKHQNSLITSELAIENFQQAIAAQDASSLPLALPGTPGPSDPPCCTVIVHCPNGVTFMAIVCDGQDYENWVAIYCGCDPD